MDIRMNRTLYMSCHAEPGFEPSALNASPLPIDMRCFNVGILILH